MMEKVLCGRYRLEENAEGLVIDLGSRHSGVTTCRGLGELHDVCRTGFGNISGGVSLADSAGGLRCGFSEMEFGATRGAAVALADLSRGVCRSGCRSDSTGGRVSLLVVIDARLSVSSVARAAITATESVTALLQDMGLRDPQGRSGSGVAAYDITVISNSESDLHLRGTGKHSKLGEIIGRVAYESVRSSAERNGVSMSSMSSARSRLLAVGYSDDVLARLMPDEKDRSSFFETLSEEGINALLAAILLLDDEISWGLVPRDIGIEAGRRMISSVIQGDVVPRDRLVDSFVCSIMGRTVR